MAPQVKYFIVEMSCCWPGLSLILFVLLSYWPTLHAPSNHLVLVLFAQDAEKQF